MNDLVDVYVRLKAGRILPNEVVSSRMVAEMVYLDLDADGEVLGVELLGVPRHGIEVDGAVVEP